MTSQTLCELFEEILARYGTRPEPFYRRKYGGVYIDVTVKEFRKSVDELASGFLSLGVRRGDRIALVSENRPEWIIADFAALSIGAITVPVFPTLTAEQMAFIIKDAGVKLAIVSNAFQCTKLEKIISSAPSLEKIVVMNKDDVREVSGVKVIAWSDTIDGAAKEFIHGERLRALPDDVVTVIYTSGTTGEPKGVMLTHKNFLSNIEGILAALPEIGPEDVFLSFLPLSHVFERIASYFAFACGAQTVYAESIDALPAMLTEVRPTVLVSVPRFFERIHARILSHVAKESSLRRKIFFSAIETGKKISKKKQERCGIPQKRDATSTSFHMRHLFEKFRYKFAEALVLKKLRARLGGRLRFAIAGGAALSPSLAEFFAAIDVLVLEGYGMTETSPVISVNLPGNYRLGTVGKPLPNVNVKIARDGEILVKGPSVMKGYYNNEQATREIINEEGWLSTGDIGSFDEDGFLRITDRKKHLFVSSGGKNIAPAPLEQYYGQAKHVEQIVIIGDARAFLSAVVVVDEPSQKEIPIKNIIQEEFSRLGRGRAPYERIRKFIIAREPFTIENGLLTPTLKPKWKEIEHIYKKEIEEMYM